MVRGTHGTKVAKISLRVKHFPNKNPEAMRDVLPPDSSVNSLLI